MPQQADDGLVSGGGGYTVPGAYEKLLRHVCKAETQVDPRQWLYIDDPAELERLEAEAAQRCEELFAERLAAGQPLELPRYLIGGHNLPLPRDHELRARDVKQVRVFSDDAVVPIYG